MSETKTLSKIKEPANAHVGEGGAIVRTMKTTLYFPGASRREQIQLR